MSIIQNGFVQDLRELAKKGDVENKRRYILMNLAVEGIITGNIRFNRTTQWHDNESIGWRN